MRLVRVFIIAAAMGAGSMAAWNRPSAAAPPPPPAAPAAVAARGSTALTDPSDLLQRLQSADPVQRDAARRELAGIANLMQQPEILQRLAEASPDAELKSYFENRILQLKALEEARRAAHLPGITLAAKNASLSDIVEALNRKLEPAKLQCAPDLNPTGTYSVDAKDQPFWEVVTGLQKQQPFSFSNNANVGLYIVGGAGANSAGEHPFAIDGPGIAYLSDLTVTRTVNLQAPEPTASFTIGLSLALISDPRLNVSRIKMPVIRNAVDNLGHAISTPPTDTSYITTTSAFTNRSFRLTGTSDMGKTLSFTVDTTLEVATQTAVGALEDLEHDEGKSVTLANRTTQLQRFTVSPTGVASLMISSSTADGSAPITSPNLQITATIVDSSGKTIRTVPVTTSYSTSFTTTDFTPPFRMEFRSVVRSVEIPLHLRFKDIPLP